MCFHSPGGGCPVHIPQFLECAQSSVLINKLSLINHSQKRSVRCVFPSPAADVCRTRAKRLERQALEACSTGKRQRQQLQIWALQHSVHSSRGPAQRFLIIGPTDRQTHNRQQLHKGAVSAGKRCYLGQNTSNLGIRLLFFFF